MRRGTRKLLAVVAMAALAAVPFRPVQAQQASPGTALAPPPSSLEQRLSEHSARQQAWLAGRERRAESRMRRLTGDGAAAGARSVEQSAIGAVNSGSFARLAIGGILVVAAMAALQADADRNR